MKPQAAMIFAAGLGTRMGEMTRYRPKPLIEVAGRSLLEHALDLVRRAGIPRIVVNTHAHADQMHGYLRAHAPDVLISHEPDLLETGGGLRQALPLLGDGPVFTLNADMVWGGGNPLGLLAETWDSDRMDALLCVVPRGKAVGHIGPGDFFIHAPDRLRRRGEASAADYVYTGAQIIRPDHLHDVAEAAFSLNVAWNLILGQSRLSGVVHDGFWVDVGRPEGVALAEAELAH